MLRYEKKAFWKFFSTYFGSVAILILSSGYFYFEEQKKTMIEKEHFSMIEYVRKMKMKQAPQHTEHFKYEVLDIEIKNFNIDNFEIQDTQFLKYMPYSWESGYILVRKDKIHYEESIFEIKIYIISVQILLLLLFALLSYFLSVRALKPMQEAITKLDNFSKDLIHDLNTPVTAILLNMKLLDAKSAFQENKAFERIKRSVNDIGELHHNLTVLLHEDTMIMQKENIFAIINEVVSIQKKIYQDIVFDVRDADYYANVNSNAFKQVMINIISNACKYNKKQGYVKIYVRDKTLYIEDNGVGIANPQHIFERSYKEHAKGHGIGLDIAKRLCEAMNIEVIVNSKLEVGTTISLLLKD